MESTEHRYLSPIRFLNYHGLTDLDDFTIAQGQELETKCKDVIIKAFQENGSGTISIDGNEYTPEIINDMFSFGDFTFCIKSHLKIWNTPLLLKILETGHVRGYDGLKIETELSEDPRLDKFVAPYLIAPINASLSKALNDANYHEAKLLLEFAANRSTDTEKYFASAIEFFESSADTFKEMRTKQSSSDSAFLDRWTRIAWNQCVNMLPECMEDTKARFCSEMYAYIEDIIDTDTDTAYNLSKFLCQVSSLPTMLFSNIQEQNQGLSHANEIEMIQAEEGGSSTMRTAVSIIATVAVLIKLMITCSRF